MKRILSVAFVLAAALVISGCDMIFVPTNLFSALDGPNISKYESLEGAELIDSLEKDTSSESFMAEIAADLTKRNTLIAKLDATIASGNAPTRLAAASLAIDIIVGTSAIDPVTGQSATQAMVDSISSVLVDLTSGGGGSGEDALASIFSSVNPDNIAKVISGFASTKEYLDHIVSALPRDDNGVVVPNSFNDTAIIPVVILGYTADWIVSSLESIETTSGTITAEEAGGGAELLALLIEAQNEGTLVGSPTFEGSDNPFADPGFLDILVAAGLPTNIFPTEGGV